MRRRLWMIGIAVACLVASGCGGGGAKGIPLTGKVLFGTQPVAEGTVCFVPDAAGSAVTARIEDGVYHTAKGEGVSPGKYVVRILGYDGKAVTGPDAAMFPLGNPLPPFETRVEIPDGGVPSLDFTMPALPPRAVRRP